MKSVFIRDNDTLDTERLPKDAGVLASVFKMLAVILVTVAVSEVMYYFDLGSQNMIMLYLLAVMVVSFSTPTYVYGILTALLCTLAYDFQITAPRMGFSFTAGLPITLFIMLMVTIVASTLTARVKVRAQLAHERERHAQQLYEINQKLLAARNMDAITALTGNYLTGHLNRPATLYTEDPQASGPESHEAPAKPSDSTALLHTLEQMRRVHRIFRIGASESDRPFDDSDYEVFNIPISSKGRTLGVIGIACAGNPLSESEFTFVRMLAGQVALALELQYLSDEQANIVVESEKEKVRGTLLRSISHDLRTPLTGILGASSTILEQKDIDDATLESLVTDIKLDAQWLIRMVENILIITRISGDNLKVRKEPEAAEEIVSEAVSIVRKRFPGYIFHVFIPDELLLVPMDGTLISQVLINLLENAVKNSPDGSLILVDLKKQDGCAVFDVIDNGSGIPESLLGSLFELHSPTREQAVDSSRGVGLGLSICKTIIRAHGGTIEGYNRDKQGARFSFRLPLREDEKADE